MEQHQKKQEKEGNLQVRENRQFLLMVVCFSTAVSALLMSCYCMVEN